MSSLQIRRYHCNGSEKSCRTDESVGRSHSTRLVVRRYDPSVPSRHHWPLCSCSSAALGSETIRRLRNEVSHVDAEQSHRSSRIQTVQEGNQRAIPDDDSKRIRGREGQHSSRSKGTRGLFFRLCGRRSSAKSQRSSTVIFQSHTIQSNRSIQREWKMISRIFVRNSVPTRLFSTSQRSIVTGSVHWRTELAVRPWKMMPYSMDIWPVFTRFPNRPSRSMNCSTNGSFFRETTADVYANGLVLFFSTQALDPAGVFESEASDTGCNQARSQFTDALTQWKR